MNCWSLIAGILMSILALAIFLPEQANAGLYMRCLVSWTRVIKVVYVAMVIHVFVLEWIDQNVLVMLGVVGRGYRGGICGDGHTCMCDGRRGETIDRNSCGYYRTKK